MTGQPSALPESRANARQAPAAYGASMRMVSRATTPVPCSCDARHREAASELRAVLDYRDSVWRIVRRAEPVPTCPRCGGPGPRAETLPGTPVTFAAIARIIVARYDLYQPFDQQAEAIAPCGMPIGRTTLANWADAASIFLSVIAERIRAYGMAAPVLGVANGPVAAAKQESIRFWAYVADGGAIEEDAPPLIWYRFTLKRSALHAVNELADYAGTIQAAVHAGYNRLLVAGRAPAAGCWENIRQRALAIQRYKGVPLAGDIVDAIDRLREVERIIAGRPAEERRQARAVRSAPILAALHDRLQRGAKLTVRRSPMGDLASDLVTFWPVFTRFVEDGRIEIGNERAEDALRLIAGDRHSWVVGRTRKSGVRAASIYTVVETCKRNGIDPCAYIAWVLPRLAADRLGDTAARSMPWHCRID